MSSKTLSYILRHGAIDLNLDISVDGFMQIDTLLNYLNNQNKNKNIITVDHIKEIVLHDQKGRFTIKDNMIRANQGHSIVSVKSSALLKKIDPLTLQNCVHGTNKKAWSSIKTEGLKKMGRNEIHFIKNYTNSVDDIKGLRSRSEVLIFLDLEKCSSSGIEFFESDNGVILVPETIRPEFFKDVLFVSLVIRPKLTDRVECH